MMKGENVTGQGQAKNHLESLFRDILDLPDLVFDGAYLGGMSNINMRAFSEDMTLVLRIPALDIRLPSVYYETEFRVSLILSENDLGPDPFAYGILPDENSTPFMAYNYEPGTVHSTVESMSRIELLRLKEALIALNSVQIARLPVYSSAGGYQNHLYQRVNSDIFSESDLTRKLRCQIESFRDLHIRLMPITETMEWTPALIHGDLRPSNIVFQDERVLFLDWNGFCMGHALYDVAYLLSEPMAEPSQEAISALFSGDTREMLAMRSLALLSSISWTVERLIRCELGQIKSSLSTRDILGDMEAYILEKTNQLNRNIIELRAMQQ